MTYQYGYKIYHRKFTLRLEWIEDGKLVIFYIYTIGVVGINAGLSELRVVVARIVA